MKELKITKTHLKEIVITVDPSYMPENGDVFDAVVCALEHFQIPAAVVERDPGAKARIVIGLDGGLIQGVTGNVPVDYLVYDYDTDGCSDEELATRPALDGGEVEVYAAGYYAAALDPAKVGEIFEALAAEGAELGRCDDRGVEVKSVVGCPDGAHICQRCFNAGNH